MNTKIRTKLNNKKANEQSSGEEAEGDTIEPLTTEDIERVKVSNITWVAAKKISIKN